MATIILNTKKGKTRPLALFLKNLNKLSLYFMLLNNNPLTKKNSGIWNVDTQSVTNGTAPGVIWPYTINRIAIPLNTAILPQENSWVLAMHYRNTQENKEEFVVLRGRKL